MSKWDGRFDGSYESSRYNDGTLETDIMNAGNGIWATSTEGLYRENDSSNDVWDPGAISGTYAHYYYNGPDDYGKAPDDRHD